MATKKKDATPGLIAMKAAFDGIGNVGVTDDDGSTTVYRPDDDGRVDVEQRHVLKMKDAGFVREDGI